MNKADKVVIFDFDGTLADVSAILRHLYSQEAIKRGWPEMTDKQYKKLRQGTIKQALGWAGIKVWQVPGLLRAGRSEFFKLSREVMLFEGAVELISDLKKDGWRIYVLSANSSETIRSVLSRNKVAKHVEILKRPALFGKAASIKNLVKKYDYDRSRVVVVGDEVRDIEAANKAGVRSIAVTWGLQDKSILKKTRPSKIASEVGEIKKHLKDLVDAR